jgi:hypothetical protein
VFSSIDQATLAGSSSDLLVFQFKPSLQGHLIAIDLAIVDATSDLCYLEPAQVTDSLASFQNGAVVALLMLASDVPTSSMTL